MVAEPTAAAMASMSAQLNTLDSKLGTFENTINARLGALEDITNKFGEKMVAMSDMIDRSGLHGSAILELQEGDMETHNTLDDIKGRLEKLEQKDGDLEAEKRNLLSNLDAEFQKHHGMLGVVVTQARDEFAQVKANLQDLYGHTSEAFQGFRARVEKLELTAVKLTRFRRVC